MRKENQLDLETDEKQLGYEKLRIRHLGTKQVRTGSLVRNISSGS